MVNQFALPLVHSTGGASRKRIHLPMQEMQETWVQSLGQEDSVE